jgi:hypothetical protein
MAKTKTEPRTAEMAPTDIQRPSRARTERRSAELQQVLRSLDVLLDRQAFMQMAGLQFDGRRDLYQIFGYDRIITAHQYREVYLRGGVAKQIVEAFPKATWRGGVEVYEDEDASVSTPFEQAFEVLEKKHHIFNTLLSADILAGLSTYSVILVGAPGNLQEELPKGNPDSLLYLAPFWGGGGPGDQSRSTSMRTQASDTDVTIESFEVDPSQHSPHGHLVTDAGARGPLVARDPHLRRGARQQRLRDADAGEHLEPADGPGEGDGRRVGILLPAREARPAPEYRQGHGVFARRPHGVENEAR